MLTKSKATKTKAPKPAKPLTASGTETDGKRPPVVFTAAQKRRMRYLFDKGHQRPLTAAELEELDRLVDALYDDAIAKADRKIKAAYPELKDVDIDSLDPMEWKELSERVRQQHAVASKKHHAKR